jgi:hypothetical protein
MSTHCRAFVEGERRKYVNQTLPAYSSKATHIYVCTSTIIQYIGGHR